MMRDVVRITDGGRTMGETLDDLVRNSIIGMAQDKFNEIIGFFKTFLAVVVIIVALAILAYWAFTAFKWLCIGRKAGLGATLNWMPFVPFMRSLYRLDIVKEDWWKMFFFEGWWLLCAFVIWLAWTVSGAEGLIFGIGLAAVYALCCLVYNVYWYYKYYRVFGIRPELALSVFVPFAGARRRNLDYQVAFTENFKYDDKRALRSLDGVKSDAMNVLGNLAMRESQSNASFREPRINDASAASRDLRNKNESAASRDLRNKSSK
ncbi:MAG: hypothetical protein FWG00_01255 [Coriobacteriia bacterium]|nr:hypothetical protein [Coriobacteriia bacterium]